MLIQVSELNLLIMAGVMLLYYWHFFQFSELTFSCISLTLYQQY